MSSLPVLATLPPPTSGFHEHTEVLEEMLGLVPGAIGGAVRFATGLLPLPAPGMASAGSSVARRAVSVAKKTGEAAEVALRYATNLRLSGRM